MSPIFFSISTKTFHLSLFVNPRLTNTTVPLICLQKAQNKFADNKPPNPTACHCTTISVYSLDILSTKTQLNTDVSALLRRCYSCRSRGDLGTCKDPFTLNLTLAEQERGVEAVPCASGWCGKFLEGGNSFKDNGESYIEVQIEFSADTCRNSYFCPCENQHTHTHTHTHNHTHTHGVRQKFPGWGKFNNFRLTLVTGRYFPQQRSPVQRLYQAQRPLHNPV
jgi:hypothetical protein